MSVTRDPVETFCQALERLLTQRHTPADVEALCGALRDGRLTIATGDRTVKVWEAETARLLRSLEGHTRPVTAVAVSADGRTVVSGSDDRTLRAWDLERGQARLLFWNDAPILALALSGDGCLLACGDRSGRVWIFEWVR